MLRVEKSLALVMACPIGATRCELLPVVIAVWTTAAAPIPGLGADLLKFLPLVRRQHLLQTFISLPPNVVHPRFRLTMQGAQLLARVAENLLHLRLLIVVQIQTLRQR